MDKYEFKIVAGTDKEYVDAFEEIREEGVFVYEKTTFFIT